MDKWVGGSRVRGLQEKALPQIISLFAELYKACKRFKFQLEIRIVMLPDKQVLSLCKDCSRPMLFEDSVQPSTIHTHAKHWRVCEVCRKAKAKERKHAILNAPYKSRLKEK